MNQRGTARLLRLAACMPAILLLFVSAAVRAQPLPGGCLIVRLAPGASITRVAQDYGLFILDEIGDRDVYEVAAPDPDTEYATEIYFSCDGRVRYYEEESSIASPEVQATPFHIAFDISPNPLAFINQIAYDLINLGNIGDPGPGSRGPRCSITMDNPVSVAVLDTGVDLNHPDLAGRLMHGFNALHPGSAPRDTSDGRFNTEPGHGTMISGVIVRTSPNAMIMPIRVLNSDGIGTLMHVIKGIHYAIKHGAQVINMSFETGANSLALEDALDEASSSGIVLVASAGNDSTSAPRFPAAYPNVIGVASVENDDTLSPYSNFGIDATVVAPGSSIRSTYLHGAFATWSGTSFAAPFVAAEAAEILAKNQGWTPAQVTDTMVQTANNIDYLNPGFAGLLGAGIIDVQAAIGEQ